MVATEASLASLPPLRGVSVAGWDHDQAVVWLLGEHDISTVVELSATIDQAMALGDGDLVVDLSGVEFMGAITVGVLLRTRRHLQMRSRSLALRSPSARARRVLDFCDLTSSIVVS
jgi:anti-anti-sigma factor